MQQIKGRLVRRAEWVSALFPDECMAVLMPQLLDVLAQGGDIWRCDDGGCVGPCKHAFARCRVKVARQAAWISLVSEAVFRVDFAGLFGNGAETDREVLERARRDATPACAGGFGKREVLLYKPRKDHFVGAVVVLEKDAITAEGGIRAIPDFRCRGVLGEACVVPIGEVAFVAAFVAEGLLELPEEDTMPWKEVAL